jgi:cytochrome c oxidase assembly protein subunit 11
MINSQILIDSNIEYGFIFLFHDILNPFIITLSKESAFYVPSEFAVFIVEFYSNLSADSTILFRPLQDKIVTPYNESTLVFFRIYNPTAHEIHGITTYTLYPYQLSPFFNKLQCFCFEEVSIRPLESLDLPLLFFIDPSIQYASLSPDLFTISLLYSFFELSI